MAGANVLHDILFSKARVALNYNAKRLWFRINPFVNKKDTINHSDYPKWPSTFVKESLQSSVVCEQYFTDESSTFQDVTVEQFWDFLYSDKWANGCSLRILQGELFDNIVNALCVLEKTNIIDLHRTVAFAKNKREFRGRFKLSNEKNRRVIEETLLIEFIYFGRRMRTTTPPPRPPCESNEEDKNLQLFDILSKWKQSVYGNDIDPHSKHTIEGNSKSQNTEKKEQMEDTTTGLECMVRSGGVNDEDGELESTAKNSVGMENNDKGATKETDTISKSTIDVIVNDPDDDTRSNHASNDNDYKLKPSKLNSNSFASTEITTNADGLDAVVVESGETFETREELYLGENRSKSFSENITVKAILHSKCKERQEAREKKKAEEKLWFIKQSQQLSQYKEVDIGLLKTMKRSPVTPVRVPTFEELIDVLEKENFPWKYKTYTRPEKISKKITKRNNKQHEAPTSGISPNDRKEQRGRIRLSPINLKKSRRQEYTTTCTHGIGGVTKSNACENWVMSQKVTKGSPRTELTTFTDEEGDRSVSVDYKSELSEFDLFRHDSPCLGLEIPVLFLTTPSGTTLEIVLYESDNESEIVDNITPKINEQRPSTTSSSSLNEEEGQMATNSASKRREWLKRKILKIGKTSRQKMFDTKKLNLKYSFERLVKEKTTKPSFYDSLKKYYTIHKVVNKYQGTPVNKDGRNPLNLETEEGEEEEDRDEKGDTIPFGKLKKFAFLDHNPQKGYEEENISFATNSMDEFTTKVLKSLDDFVVRKEQVVSDFYSKTSMSITFTKKSAFKI